jgi:hypothetical protein
MAAPDTIHDATTLSLRAMVWALGEPTRATRLLDLTGLTAEDLRASAASRTTQAAVLGFLAAYEPDLIACAADLGIKPEALVAAQRELEA